MLYNSLVGYSWHADIPASFICSQESMTSFVDSDQPVTYITRTRKTSLSMDRASSRAHAFSSIMEPSDARKQEFETKSFTLPGNRSKYSSSQRTYTSVDLPTYSYRALSPTLPSGDQHIQGAGVVTGKSPSFKRSIFRRRAESADNYKVKHL